MRVRDLKGVAMFLFEPMIVPFGERQKPRARPAGILTQQIDLFSYVEINANQILTIKSVFPLHVFNIFNMLGFDGIISSILYGLR